MSSVEYRVRAAEWPGDEAAATRLLRNYAAFLASNPNGAASICLANFNDELAQLAQTHVEPDAVLLLAEAEDGTTGGCVAVKRLPDEQAMYELKRLWTEPVARGHGVGRLLAETAIAWVRVKGGRTLLLDTVSAAMPQAVALYRSLGFTQTARYNKNPVADLLFMELRVC